MKRANLLTLCGEQTYDTVCALIQPRTPAAVDYDDIVAALQEHYDPRPSEVYCRARFQRRDQLEGEKVAEYVAALKKLAADCNFGTLTATAAATAQEGGSTATPANTTMLPLDVMLRDRFVCGLRDAGLQQRLFAETGLTFSKAYDIAQRAESAGHQQRDIRRNVEPVHHTSQQSGHSTSKAKSSRKTQRCWRCDDMHDPQVCRYKTATCNFCQKLGHIERACISKRKQLGPKTSVQRNNNVDAQEGQTQDTSRTALTSSALYDLNAVVNLGTRPKITTEIMVHQRPIRFEVDSGAACTLISEDTFRATWRENAPALQQDDTQLRTWSGHSLPLLGCANVDVYYNGQTHQLPLLVVHGSGSSLLGRNWFTPLGVVIGGVHHTPSYPSVEQLQDKYKAVFSEEIPGNNGPPVTLELREDATPKFLKARSVPFALRTSVENELDRLQEQGIIEPTQHSEWATPLVVVRKKNGTLRLCGDYRSTVNLATKASSYPLPTPEEVFSTLRGGKIFSTLDLTQAYQQLKVSESTSELLTINTIKGLYKVKRLPFGISAAPAIFQKFMESTLSGIPGVCVYLDDVIVGGASNEEHTERLELILERLANANLRISKEKCVFAVPEVKFLGHQIDAQGIHPTEDKVRAITEARAPTNKQELQSFLGLLTFYDRFLEHRATVANDLYQLLQKEVPWTWSPRHQESFVALKQLLRKSTVLRHYDERRPLLLACDASPYGVGAVLSQVDDQGREAPIAFASRTLSQAERNYSQLDKEGLAIVYAADHFRQYITGRKVTFITDHRPLLGIMGPQKPMPQTLSPRMTRWCIKMSAYDYELVHRTGKKHQNADALSRLPLDTTIDEPPPPGDILMFEALPNPPLTADTVAASTQECTVLKEVYAAIQEGNVQKLKGEHFNAYRKRAAELSTHRGCVTLGSRVVIPAALREQAMSLVHAGHRGIVAMKKCARSYMWWPGIDHDIELTVHDCQPCQCNHRSPPRAPIPEWERPDTPWHTLHIDFAGPIEGCSFLVVVDAYTKWLEVKQMATTTSAAVIDTLRSLFATFGLPRKVVSDNGTPFVSTEILKFYSDNGVSSVTSAPYHPATNGQAERYVAELKRALTKDQTGTMQRRIARFLFRQHNTVQSTTDQTPAKLMFGREMRTQLTAIVPEPSAKAPSEEEKLPHSRRIESGQRIYARQFHRKPGWVEATALKRIGLRSWLVDIGGKATRRHLNQLRRSGNLPREPPIQAATSTEASFHLAWHLAPDESAPPPAGPEHKRNDTQRAEASLPSASRASTRPRRPPDRFQATI